MSVKPKNWRAWFTGMWPTRARLVIEGYVDIGQRHPLFLADQALRAGVYADGEAKDLFEAGVNEGKRRHALEIIRLCKARPEDLLKLIEVKPREET